MRAVVFVALLLAPFAAAPASAADSYRLDVVDSTDAPREDFGLGETVVFRVTVAPTTAETVDHRIYLYEGEGTSGNNVWIVDDGQTTRTSPSGTRVFRVYWDQKADGVQVPAGAYTAQYRSPDGAVTATFTIEVRPDFRVTFLRVQTTEGGEASPQRLVVGCVLNEGLREVASVNVALSSRSAYADAWFPQLAQSVGMQGDEFCPWVAGGGTAFQIPFNAAAAPGGFALRAVRAEANFDRAHAETDVSDNAREAAATWLL